jgi:hypothetical protein
MIRDLLARHYLPVRQFEVNPGLHAITETQLVGDVSVGLDQPIAADAAVNAREARAHGGQHQDKDDRLDGAALPVPRPAEDFHLGLRLDATAVLTHTIFRQRRIDATVGTLEMPVRSRP